MNSILTYNLYFSTVKNARYIVAIVQIIHRRERSTFMYINTRWDEIFAVCGFQDQYYDRKNR